MGQAGTVDIVLHLDCFVRQEPEVWVAGCPHLEVFSQGGSQEEAQAALNEALILWVESCLERNTLGRALVELGWHRRNVSAQNDAEVAEPEESVLGEAFPVSLTIPAYQAAALMDCASS